MKLCHIGVELRIKDLWVGVRWQRLAGWLDVWVCLVPCFPVHFVFGPAGAKVEYPVPALSFVIEDENIGAFRDTSGEPPLEGECVFCGGCSGLKVCPGCGRKVCQELHDSRECKPGGLNLGVWLFSDYGCCPLCYPKMKRGEVPIGKQ